MSWCMAEDEEACLRVGWKPYHVREGFGLDESTITLGSTLLWGNNMAPSTTNPQKLMELLAWDISERSQFALGSGRQFTFRTVLMTEPVAAILAEKYRSPEALEKDLIDASRRPVKERAFANYYANPGGAKDCGQYSLRQYQGHIRKDERGQMTPTPQWYDSPETEQMTIPVMKKGMTAFLITGDAARNKVQTMPGGGYATIKIELPENWDSLMTELGYEPLERDCKNCIAVVPRIWRLRPHFRPDPRRSIRLNLNCQPSAVARLRRAFCVPRHTQEPSRNAPARSVEQMIHSEKCVKSGKTHWKNYSKPQETHWKNYDNYLKSRWKKCIFVPG